MRNDRNDNARLSLRTERPPQHSDWISWPAMSRKHTLLLVLAPRVDERAAAGVLRACAAAPGLLSKRLLRWNEGAGSRRQGVLLVFLQPGSGDGDSAASAAEGLLGMLERLEELQVRPRHTMSARHAPACDPTPNRCRARRRRPSCWRCCAGGPAGALHRCCCPCCGSKWPCAGPLAVLLLRVRTAHTQRMRVQHAGVACCRSCCQSTTLLQCCSCRRSPGASCWRLSSPSGRCTHAVLQALACIRAHTHSAPRTHSTLAVNHAPPPCCCQSHTMQPLQALLW